MARNNRGYWFAPLACLAAAAVGCSHSSASATASKEEIAAAVQSSQNLAEVQLQDAGANRFTGTARDQNGTTHQLTVARQGKELRYEGTSANSTFSGTMTWDVTTSSGPSLGY